eukprot:CAMPEP_0183450386 /NCGR_PEP_ID=MMETSP0370-20130417/112454_1 /TAXON_ID=268820 /ORGANISM="Peridinium aciculiferum, Strain PAER-2" /LENGTH=583 /DNA_ID=CAMNT_0025641535 /DNA_START=12 /DNA_END=1759 /DNA_ORIENTATION=-
MPPRRKVPARRGGAAKKAVVAKAAKSKRDEDDSDGSSYSGSESCSRTSDDGSSSDGGSDEDDPREYKHGGYHPVTPYQLYTARYRVLSKLGAGAFSTVWLCADEKEMGPQGADLVAMKVCKSKKSVTEQALDEVELLERLQDAKHGSPHVVKMMGHFWHSGPNGRHKCMVFEVMGENLLALVKHYDYNGLPLAMVKRLARHTLMGLAYIHSRGVIHTDVKLENVLVQRHDLGELVKEACRAHSAYTETRASLEGLTKSQKKRAKMKEKKKNAKAQDEGTGAAADKKEEAPAAAAAAAEAGDDEEDPDKAAAQACGTPVPPVRQRERFETFLLEQVFAKLADFGNGCRSHKQVTDDIQTRQYRSPEVIIGAKWDETADNWSAACMFFELITGDFLFDPRTGDSWNRDEDHLALMAELIGDQPPKDWATSGKYSRDFFTNGGKLKHIKNLKFWSLPSVLMEKYEMDQAQADEIAGFLSPMLRWLPKERQHASEALKNSWVQPAPGEVDLPPEAKPAEVEQEAASSAKFNFDFDAPPRGGTAAAAAAAAATAPAEPNGVSSREQVGGDDVASPAAAAEKTGQPSTA